MVASASSGKAETCSAGRHEAQATERESSILMMRRDRNSSDEAHLRRSNRVTMFDCGRRSSISKVLARGFSSDLLGSLGNERRAADLLRRETLHTTLLPN